MLLYDRNRLDAMALLKGEIGDSRLIDKKRLYLKGGGKLVKRLGHFYEV